MRATFLRLAKYSQTLLSDRQWLAALFATNILGFIYGIYYYSYQLSITPAYLWIFVIDSPLPVILFAIICGMILFESAANYAGGFKSLKSTNTLKGFHDLKKSPPQSLLLFSFFGLVKYGLWTDIVIYLFRDYFFSINPLIYGLNFPLHFGMILEGLLLLHLLKPKMRDIIFVGGFYFLNDYLDYFYGTVTLIPEGYHTFLMIESFAMTVALIAIGVYLKKLKS
ncbi:Uncharacterised protein [uncultured archaeon]|nr:Uncharacterised protein [uncultured archaeon]